MVVASSLPGEPVVTIATPDRGVVGVIEAVIGELQGAMEALPSLVRLASDEH
jgi:hypothetical protein